MQATLLQRLCFGVGRSPAGMIVCGLDAFNISSSVSLNRVIGTPSCCAILALADGMYGSTMAAASATTPSKPAM